MRIPSWSTTIAVTATPEHAFAAINDVRGWWSRDVDGSTDTVGSEFAYRGNHDGQNVHRATIRVTELVPGERVVWDVLDNWMSFIDDQAEWTGTRIVFEISPTASGSAISFRHEGLVPVNACYDVCSDAWTMFIHDSLRTFVTTGGGQPMERLESTTASA